MEEMPSGEHEGDSKPNQIGGEYDLVWHSGSSLFDGRYRLEVRRSATHGSSFHILDGHNDMTEVECCTYDYIPEAQQDSRLWNAIVAKRLAIRILDAPYLPQQIN